MEITPDAGGLHRDLLEGVRGAFSVHILGAEDLTSCQEGGYTLS